MQPKVSLLSDELIGHDSIWCWKESGSMDAITRARIYVRKILASYKPSSLGPLMN
jgi:trimethylamine:corrinoid methyltransferase-like protein